MVLLTMTPAIVQGLRIYNNQLPSSSKPLFSAAEPSLSDPHVGNPILHYQVLELSKYLREQVRSEENHDIRSNKVSCQLDDLLRGSQVYVAPAKPKPEPVEIHLPDISKSMLKCSLLDLRI